MQSRYIFSVRLFVHSYASYVSKIRISASSEKFRQEEGEIRDQLSGLRKYLRDAIIESFPRHDGADARGRSLFPTRLQRVTSCVYTTRNMALSALQIVS